MVALKFRVQQPKSLGSLSTEALGCWIASQPERLSSPASELQRRDPTKAEVLISGQIEITRNYLESYLPSMVQDALATETMQKLKNRINRNKDSDNRLISRMLETLFTNNLTCISIIYFSDVHLFGDIFVSNSFKLTGLNCLDLRAMHINEVDMIKIVKELPSLKQLFLNHCTDIVIRYLAQNCKLLEDLESWYDDNIHDKDIIYLLRHLPNLKSVSLMHSTLDSEGILNLLSSKNIETKICMANNNSTRKLLTLEHIICSEKFAGKQFNLKYYRNCSDTTYQQLQSIIKMCPLIQEIDLDQTSSKKILQLLPLIELKHLHKLKLRGFSFYESLVKDVLEERGCNLVHLELEIEQLDLNALICISQMCPNLKSLYIINFISEKQLINAVDCNRKLESAFRKLEKLTLRVCWMRAHPTEQQLFYLLSNCPNVKFIDILVNVSKNRIPITDNFMSRVLDINPLIHLQELNIICHGYTTSTINGQDCSGTTMLFIDRIIKNCIKPPEIMINVYNIQYPYI